MDMFLRIVRTRLNTALQYSFFSMGTIALTPKCLPCSGIFTYYPFFTKNTITVLLLYTRMRSKRTQKPTKSKKERAHKYIIARLKGGALYITFLLLKKGRRDVRPHGLMIFDYWRIVHNGW